MPQQSSAVLNSVLMLCSVRFRQFLLIPLSSGLFQACSGNSCQSCQSCSCLFLLVPAVPASPALPYWFLRPFLPFLPVLARSFLFLTGARPGQTVSAAEMQGYYSNLTLEREIRGKTHRTVATNMRDRVLYVICQFPAFLIKRPTLAGLI